jgi:hypothetical protein
MSQQMHFNEEQGYAGYTPALDEHTDSYNQRIAEAQKIGQYQHEKRASPGQRLALAIVSVGVLFLCMTLFAGGDSSVFIVVAKLVAMLVVGVAVIAINAIFNEK